MGKKALMVEGYKLKFCKKCNYVWEQPYDMRKAITVIKYSNLSSYKLKRNRT